MRSSEEIQKEMERLNAELHAAKIAEGKLDAIAEVKKRLLEKVPGFAFVDYVLWPLRVQKGEVTTTEARGFRKVRWTGEMVAMLLNGMHDEIVNRFKLSAPAVRAKGCHISKTFKWNRKLEPKEESINA